MAPPLNRLKQWARAIRADIIALWIAARDPRTPWLARIVAASTAAYALSPIDLIPDFIPIVGYLDDLLIVPLGLALALRLIPAALLSEFRARAACTTMRPTSYIAAALIFGVWLAALFFIGTSLFSGAP